MVSRFSGSDEHSRSIPAYYGWFPGLDNRVSNSRHSNTVWYVWILRFQKVWKFGSCCALLDSIPRPLSQVRKTLINLALMTSLVLLWRHVLSLIMKDSNFFCATYRGYSTIFIMWRLCWVLMWPVRLFIKQANANWVNIVQLTLSVVPQFWYDMSKGFSRICIIKGDTVPLGRLNIQLQFICFWNLWNRHISNRCWDHLESHSFNCVSKFLLDVNVYALPMKLRRNRWKCSDNKSCFYEDVSETVNILTYASSLIELKFCFSIIMIIIILSSTIPLC